MTDSGDRSGDNAPPATSEGPNWQAKYDGLQRLLGQRTRELEEARQLVADAQERSQAAERQATDYRQLYETLYTPSTPQALAAPTEPDEDEYEPRVDVNNPRRSPMAEPPRMESSDDYFAELAKFPSEAWGRQ